MSIDNGAVHVHPGAASLDQLVATAEVVKPSQGGHPVGNTPSNTSVSAGASPPADAPVVVDPWPEPPQGPAYHGLAGEIVAAIGPHTEADLIALLVQLLVVFGSLIGRTAHFVVEGSRHHANLFVVLVGLTSKGRKGTSWAQVARLAESVEPGWKRDRVVSGLSSGEGLIFHVRDPVEKDEPIREGKGKLVTGYQAVVQDEGVTDKRLLTLESEFALVLKLLLREGNTLSAVVRQAWETGDLRTLTKNSPTKATGAHISIVGHITRDETRRYLAETELANGFANRFLWVCVRRSKRLPDGGQLHTVDFTGLVNQFRAAVEFARQQGALARDAAAGALWAVVYDYLSEGRPGLLGAVLGRAEAQVMRLALIYALLDRSTAIGHAHLLAALDLWRYIERSTRYIFGDSLGDPDADKLLDALRKRPEGMTTSLIYAEVFGNNFPAARIRGALARLLEYGLVWRETVQGKGAGRPAELWHAGGTPT